MDDFFSFDQILLDAPCSGSGTIYCKDEKLEKNFTPQFIQKSVAAQTALIRKAINLLKSGREMVYSTCSIIKEENEEIVQKVIKEQKVEVVPIEGEKYKQLPLLPTIIEGTLCVAPSELYEGFFIAKIRKI